MTFDRCGLGLILWALVQASAVLAAPLKENLVVMVDAQHGSGGKSSFGAGVIMSQTEQRTVIATAFHVLANQDGDLASRIEIETQALRGRHFNATVSRAYVDPALDLAVIFVDHDTGPRLSRLLVNDAVKQLSPTALDKQPGATVEIIGAMNAERWAIGTREDTITSASRQRLLIRTSSARTGASGGGVFDREGRILGIISSIDSGTGQLTAIPISTVIDRLRRWHIEVGLKEADAASTMPEIQAQVISGLRVQIEPMEPFYDKHGYKVRNFDHRVRALLSPAVIELTPRIEIRHSPDGDDKRAVLAVLNGPDYVTTLNGPIIHEAELWAVLRDGRQFGPIKTIIDLLQAPLEAARRVSPSTLQQLEASIKFDRWNKEEGRLARARAQVAVQEMQEKLARNQEQAWLNQLPLVIAHWRATCSLLDTWKCKRPSYLPSSPPGFRIANAIHSIRIGGSAKDLNRNVPLDSGVDLGEELPTQVASVLSGGSKEVVIEIRLINGVVLGPQPMCNVRPARRNKPEECR